MEVHVIHYLRYHQMSRGLYIGKFAPLHEGHMNIISYARSQCDEVVIMIYDSPQIHNLPPLSVRRKWLEFSNVKIIECWDAPTEIGYDIEVMKHQIDYIVKKLSDIKIDFVYSAEDYGTNIAYALGAIHNRMEKTKIESVPMSATLFRSDPYKYRKRVSSNVYSEFITKAVFLGGPSTGKSTLVKALAEHHSTAYVEEYGRTYWERYEKTENLLVKT